MRLSAPFVLLLVGAAVLAACRPSDEVSFSADVRPILNKRCMACHGGVKQAGGFSMLFEEDVYDTTESGRRPLVPGDPGQSEIVRRITHPDPDERMPADGPPLSSTEVDVLRRWIDQGAPWERHWAFTLPETPTVPDVQDAAWPKGDLDRFVLARLEAERRRPNGEADCARLLRRVALDLTGLPPTPAEADAFCDDPSDAAYEAAVDRLLASPRYGERWAAPWLDLARYADSRGYERDAYRAIWRYRDWVIDAFNQDLPFDDFTTWQLAGDLLPGASKDQLLATAFHRNTMTNDEGGTSDEEFRVAAVIDRVNTTMEVWQGVTMACVQCHSHPYDPIRHEDYYRLYALFNNTADEDRSDEAPRLREHSPDAEAEIRALLSQLGAPEAPEERALSERVDAFLYPAPRLVPSRADSAHLITSESEFSIPQREGALLRYDSLDLTGITSVWLDAPVWTGGTIDVVLDRPDGPSIGRARLDATEGRRVLPVPVAPTEGVHDVFFVFGRNDEAPSLKLHWISLRPDAGSPARSAAELRLANVQAQQHTPILRELPPAQQRVTRVFERGNWLTPADTVAPGVPASLGPAPPGPVGDRLDLARWIVRDDNPLTARVAVNRFWQQLFGRGLVATPEDFGTQGERPSHPALLDYLARRFVRAHGWSVKALLREIVTSATYRQSAKATPEQLAADADNRLLGRGPRVRLTAEQVRDQALAVSGLLSDSIGGPSVMPPQPEGIWDSPYNGATWTPSEGESRYRRALYTHWKRTAPYPSFLTFDMPTREVCVSRRVPTNTPLQALVTLNDPVYVEAAHALARRMAEAGETPDDRLRYGYRQALFRAPDAATLADLRALYEDALAHYRAAPGTAQASLVTLGDPASPRLEEQAALALVASTLLNLDAFLMKE